MAKKCIFDHMSVSDVEELLFDPRCEIQRFHKGDILADEKHFSHKLGIVRTGKARVSSRDVGGVTMRILTEGACFGVASLFHDADRYISKIEAMEECEVLFMPQAVLLDGMKKHPILTENYIGFLTDRIVYLNALIDAYSSPSVEAKLARYLVAYTQGNDVPFDVNMTELSRVLGFGRASLYRALETFVQAGWIRKNGKTLEIVNLDEMSQI